MDNYTSPIPDQPDKSNIISGIEKPSKNISAETEIPLTTEAEPLCIHIPQPVSIEPAYYECDENYSTFETD
jgi:hypothetical protein